MVNAETLNAKEPDGKLLEQFLKMIEDGNVLKVKDQDQTIAPFQYYLMKHLNDNVKLAKSIGIDDDIITLQALHGFSVGEYIAIWENDVFLQARVVNVNVNEIKIEVPSANNYTTAAKVVRGVIDAAVNGATPQEYKFQPFNLETPIDISSVVITIQSGSGVPDDGKFGGIAALTNGLYFRLENGRRANLGNYTTNKAFRDRGSVVEYTESAPAGTNGINIFFNIKSTFGIVIRTFNEDRIIGLIRDNLTALDSLTISILGKRNRGE